MPKKICEQCAKSKEYQYFNKTNSLCNNKGNINMKSRFGYFTVLMNNRIAVRKH